MAFLSSMDICASGMTAQRLRLDIAAENITNRDTTRTEGGGPYRKKSVVFREIPSTSFQEVLGRAANGRKGGVEVEAIVLDQSPMDLVYNPDHPDARPDGYVEMPNVDMVKEMTDAMAATQAYSANVTAFNTLKSVVAKGLEIGR